MGFGTMLVGVIIFWVKICFHNGTRASFRPFFLEEEDLDFSLVALLLDLWVSPPPLMTRLVTLRPYLSL